MLSPCGTAGARHTGTYELADTFWVLRLYMIGEAVPRLFAIDCERRSCLPRWLSTHHMKQSDSSFLLSPRVVVDPSWLDAYRLSAQFPSPVANLAPQQLGYEG